MNEKTFRFRPSARMISTIGENIIKDAQAAIFELVKNAYDADASKVDIEFHSLDQFKIIIKDNGHGMNTDTIINKWLVPSTEDKLIRKTSPKGRLMQGRKGIGRFSAAKLGERVTVISVVDNIKSTISIDWTKFTGNKFLDEIELIIDNEETNEANGTTFIITGSEEKKKLWTNNEIKRLLVNLRRLQSVSSLNEFSKDNFEVTINFDNFDYVKEYYKKSVDISPYDVLSHYNYRIYGTVNKDGIAEFIYENKKLGADFDVTEVNYKVHDEEYDDYKCGEFTFDIRVFDRETEDIRKLSKVLISNDNKPLTLASARSALNDLTGVSVYREGFRVLPYGDPDYDWLEQDRRRVQNPSRIIGFNQISGSVYISDEESSKLVENSARDGFQENQYYKQFKSRMIDIITYLENKRFLYRRSLSKSKKQPVSVSEKLLYLSNFTEVKEKVSALSLSLGVSQETVAKLIKVIDADQKAKEKIAEDIEKQIAVYQDQATLGNITSIILHEINKPLGIIRNDRKNLDVHFNKYKLNRLDRNWIPLEKAHHRIHNATLQIIRLINRIEPFSERSTDRIETFPVKGIIEDTYVVYQNLIESNRIKWTDNTSNNLQFTGWRSDLLNAVSNIVENAIYWLSESDHELKTIEINSSYRQDDTIQIDIVNNGPLIETSMLDGNLLFEPGISRKKRGTGLGLSIAGDCIRRNNGVLQAENLEDSVKFTILLKGIKDE